MNQLAETALAARVASGPMMQKLQFETSTFARMENYWRDIISKIADTSSNSSSSTTVSAGPKRSPYLLLHIILRMMSFSFPS